MRALALGVLVVTATGIGLLNWAWPLRRTNKVSDDQAAPERHTVLRHPALWLLLVTAIIYVNQVLFTVYAVRVWHGDVSVIARSLPAGWFDLADRNPAITLLARHFPAPEMLSWSVLRVQAALELPLVVLAYLTVCWWYSPGLYERARHQVWLASAFYTATFCLIEWSLPNPYTTSDILVRIGAGFLVPVGISRLTGPSRRGVRSSAELTLFIISVAALGYLVLLVYDTALLYNLGHLGKSLPHMAISAVVLIVARLTARATRNWEPGPGIDTIGSSLSSFLALFFVPALAIRYGLSFGAPLLSLTTGLVLTITALILGSREALRRPGTTRTTWFAQITVAAAAGAAAACGAFALASGYPETRLLAAAVVFFGVTIAICEIADRTTISASNSTRY